MNRPLLLDLFCGAGGAAMGYHRAGFDVVGVDIAPQPHYPFEFHQGDALDFLKHVGRQSHWRIGLRDFDAIHASPPCQAYSLASKSRRNSGHEYPDLLAPTRELLRARALPWVIENVVGAPMQANIALCGCQVGLALRRVRYFETSWAAAPWVSPHHHPEPVVSVVGHGTPSWVRKQLGYNPTIADYREAMGIDWMNRRELSQAIPPAYTELIGAQLLQHVKAAT
jgi:DNA (cytosine-5)-methyltransferase 1